KLSRARICKAPVHRDASVALSRRDGGNEERASRGGGSMLGTCERAWAAAGRPIPRYERSYPTVKGLFPEGESFEPKFNSPWFSTGLISGSIQAEGTSNSVRWRVS